MRAKELASALGRTHLLTTINAGLCRHYSSAGDLSAARVVATELAATPEHERGAREARAAGHVALTVADLCSGDMTGAVTHGDAVVRAYEAAQAAGAAMSRRRVEGVATALAHRALAQCALGRPVAGLRGARHGLEIARSLGPSFTLALAYHHLALIQLQTEPSSVGTTAAGLIAFCRDNDFTPWLAAGEVLEGWALAHDGDGGRAIGRIEAGIVVWERSGARIGLPMYYWLLADALNASGERERALETLQTAEQKADETGERWFRLRRRDSAARSVRPREGRRRRSRCSSMRFDVPDR